MLWTDPRVTTHGAEYMCRVRRSGEEERLGRLVWFGRYRCRWMRCTYQSGIRRRRRSVRYYRRSGDSIPKTSLKRHEVCAEISCNDGNYSILPYTMNEHEAYLSRIKANAGVTEVKTTPLSQQRSSFSSQNGQYTASKRSQWLR